jgi:glutamyl/glutaminyl-tRNA synthetase
MKGRFILRIEDTDLDRVVPGSEAAIYEDLKWLGLEWDEGPHKGGPLGPYKCSERNDIYDRELKRLQKVASWRERITISLLETLENSDENFNDKLFASCCSFIFETV